MDGTRGGVDHDAGAAADDVILTYVLGVVGLAIVAYAAAWIMKRTINVRIAERLLVRMLEMQDVDRFLKLCRGAGEHTSLAAPKAAAEAAIATGSKDPITLAATIDGAFDPIEKARVLAWTRMCELGLFGAAVAGGAVALAFSDGVLGQPHYVFAATAALGGIWFFVKRPAHAQDFALLRQRLLPKLAETLAGITGPTMTPVAEPVRPQPAASQATTTSSSSEGQARAVVVRVTRDGVLVHSKHFDQDVIKIGRMDRAHVRVDAPGIDRMHAVLERTDEGLSIIDLGSNAGTFVNGQRVNKAEVDPEDVVQIGPFELRCGVTVAPPTVLTARSEGDT